MVTPSGTGFRPRPRIATFLFHEVTDQPDSTGFQRPAALPYKHSVAEFQADLQAIGSAGRTPELISQVDLGRSDDHLLLTFDDGGRSALEAADQLESRGWRGHFFVVTDRLEDPLFLAPTEVREIRRRGHLIGSHSHTHPDIFYDLSYAAMLAEWRTSKVKLEDILGEEIPAASVPGGDMDQRTKEAAAEAGIRYLFTSEPVTVPEMVGGLVCLGRVCPRRGTPAGTVARLASFRGFRREQAKRAAKRAAKRILSPLYRRRVQAHAGA